jgi:putative DNA methylase
VALGPLNEKRLLEAFDDLSATVGERIRGLYRAADEKGRSRDVLYFFWVKQAVCPRCDRPVDLFSTRILARNACPNRKPRIEVCCPQCGDVFRARNSDRHVRCPSCGLAFDPHQGSAEGTRATCGHCSKAFIIAEAVRALGSPPAHRLYAKLLLLPEGAKRYLPATAQDQRAYEECTALLRSELAHGMIRLPVARLSDGYNTRQAMGYHYRHWRDFFNDRQLLALGWLQEAIAGVEDEASRDALFTLFSGVLEFNNLFASYKGEGTGAVRHMFSHHILKPERMPIEANVWGTPKSSGSFRNLFSSRLMRAIRYRRAPFEVTARGQGKAYPGTDPFSGRVETSWPAAGHVAPRGIYLSCGSSHDTGLPHRSVDLIVTDPPFFDNVHYSELADFFHAWESLYPRGFVAQTETTRDRREVQDSRAEQFAHKLCQVLLECGRVLKDGGLLAFSYHHSRAEGWTSLAQAIHGAGFSVVNAHPVKAEMSVAAPKSQAKEPIQLDVIFVCRKREEDPRQPVPPSEAAMQAEAFAREKLARLRGIGLSHSRNDCRVVVMSQFLALLGPVRSPELAVEALVSLRERLDAMALSLSAAIQQVPCAPAADRGAQQLSLFSSRD